MTKNQKLKIFINSLLLFLLSFIISYFIFQISKYFFAKINGISTTINNGEIIFTSNNASSVWDAFSVIQVYGFPPFISLIIAILLRKLYEQAKRTPSNFKLYITWQIIHFYNFFFGGIVAGLLTQSGFVYFMNWMYLPFFVQVILALAGIIILYFQHLFVNYAFSQTSPHKYLINSSLHLKYKFYLVFLPYLTGIIILILFIFYNNYHEIILLVTLLIPLLQIRIHIDEDDVKLVRNSKVFYPNYIAIIPILIFFILIQFT